MADITKDDVIDFIANMSVLELSELNGTDGFALRGIDIGDNAGRSVSSAGDVNGDGFDDLLIGANRAAAGGFEAGQSYVVFGGDLTGAVTQSGDENDNLLTGTAGADVIDGSRGNDTLIGSGGADVLLGGSGDDVLAVSDMAFARLIGGRGGDTLRLDGSTVALNLREIADNRVQGIEAIDLAGSGPNTLTLNLREVLNISDESNTLLVTGDDDDRVILDSGWTAAGSETIGGTTFDVFTRGAATLKIAQAVEVQEEKLAPNPLELSDLLASAGGDGTVGFLLHGSDTGDWAGVWVRSAGDVNADGLDDVVIGAQNADTGGENCGEACVVFGQSSEDGFPAADRIFRA